MPSSRSSQVNKASTVPAIGLAREADNKQVSGCIPVDTLQGTLQFTSTTSSTQRPSKVGAIFPFYRRNNGTERELRRHFPNITSRSRRQQGFEPRLVGCNCPPSGMPSVPENSPVRPLCHWDLLLPLPLKQLSETRASNQKRSGPGRSFASYTTTPLSGCWRPMVL